jgi:hypothetical protein
VSERREGDEIVRLHIATLIGRSHPLHPFCSLLLYYPIMLGHSATDCKRQPMKERLGTLLVGRGSMLGKWPKKIAGAAIEGVTLWR